MDRDIYYGRVKLHGEENEKTVVAAGNYATSLRDLQHFDEARSLLRKTMPIARRVLGHQHIVMFRMKKVYAEAQWRDDRATLDDLREAVNSLEDLAPTARRVLGGAHPNTSAIEEALRDARATLRARETSV